MAACAALELVSSTAVCAFPGRVCVSALQCSSLYCPRRCVACSCMLVLQMHVFVQQQPMLCQEVYGLQQHVLHLYCLSARACAAPGRVFLVFSRTFVLHLACLSTRALCSTKRCLSTRALRCTWMCLPTGALRCTWVCKNFCCTCACLKSFVTQLDVSANKSAAQAVTVGVLLKIFFGLFRNSSVCFGCFDIGSKHRNKPKQTEMFFFGFTKQTKTNPKQILFRFVSVRTKIYFCLFRGHPTGNFCL